MHTTRGSFFTISIHMLRIEQKPTPETSMTLDCNSITYLPVGMPVCVCNARL